MKDKKETLNKLILITLAIFLASYVYLFDPFYLRNSESIANVRIFKDEIFWPLAVAVDRGDVTKIKYFIDKHPEWMNQTGSRFGINLLYFAVTTEKYDSAEALLKAGADPNTRMIKLGGQTALYDASCFSSVDSDAKKDPMFVNLLLKYGADPNLYYLGGEDIFSNSTEIGDSPLIHSIGCGIEKTKALVNNGADINHKTLSGKTAAIQSLLTGNVLPEYLAYSRYLIVEKQANITDGYCIKTNKVLNNCTEYNYPVDLLRDWWVYDLNSENYKIKMEIVSEFKKQSIDYWKTRISEATLEKIKKRYPDTWQEYIKKY